MTPAIAPIGVVLQGPAATLPSLAARLEDAAVSTIWLGDYFQAALVRAAVVAQATRRIRVGTHVLQAFARSPLATALAAQELQELAAGRFVLGLGSQFPEANRRWHGVIVERPVAALTDYVAAVRGLLGAPAGKAAQFQGSHFTYRVPPFRPPAALPPPPVWIGGAGPASVALAARAADGMAGHLLWTYAHVQDAVRPTLGHSLPLTVPRFVVPPAAEAAAHRRMAHYLATGGYQDLLRNQGTPVDPIALRTALRAGDQAALTGLVERYAQHWCIRSAAELARHRVDAAAHGVSELALLVPADAADPARAAAYEDELVRLIEGGAGQPATVATRKVC